MADNPTLPATGSAIATDDVSGVHFQRVKLTLGADGVNDGDVSASNPIPVGGAAAHDAAVAGNPVTIGGRASAAAPTDVSADGDAVRAWLLRNGAQCVAVTAAGALIGGDATNGLDVDVTRLPALVAGTANIGDVDVVGGTVAHDGAGTSINPLLIGGYASAAAPTSVSADGDAVRAWMLRNGATCTVLTAAGALIGGDATNGLDVDVTRLPGTLGGVADDAAASGSNPLLIGAEARSSNRSAVANGDLVRLMADLFGKQVVLMGAPPELDVDGQVTLTNTTTASDVIATQGSGAKIVVTSITILNSSATVAPIVEIRDGTTVKWQGPIGVNGGGVVITNPRGLFKSSGNAAITARCATATTSVYVFVSGYVITN